MPQVKRNENGTPNKKDISHTTRGLEAMASQMLESLKSQVLDGMESGLIVGKDINKKSK